MGQRTPVIARLFTGLLRHQPSGECLHFERGNASVVQWAGKTETLVASGPGLAARRFAWFQMQVFA
jgi:hypothetical protein